jgi:hypothetical protein
MMNVDEGAEVVSRRERCEFMIVLCTQGMGEQICMQPVSLRAAAALKSCTDRLIRTLSSTRMGSDLG